MRKLARLGEVVVVNATDPLNLVGVLVPGPAVPAVRTREVTYVDGIPDVAGTGLPSTGPADAGLAGAARLAG